jgi:simple sugar transport system ATP-binding protein
MPLIEFCGVSKTFGGAMANGGIGFAVGRGEIHAVVGENGAGKTTLMNLLAGLHKPDAGQIRIQGQPVRFAGPQDAIRAGIGMVHQHFMLVDRFTVLQNIMISCEKNFGWLKTTQARQKIATICRDLGLSLDLDCPVDALPVGLRQRVEIVKLLYRGGDILIFDEPTAVLTPAETEDLLALLRQMRAQGKTVMYVSHKLSEVLAIADRVTVLRQGRLIGTVEAAKATREELVEMMIGRAIFSAPQERSQKIGPTMLELSAVCCQDGRRAKTLQGLSLRICGGEIYGVVGVSGNGQQELTGVVTGAVAPVSGSVVIAGVDIAGEDAATVRRRGVGLIPEDRDRQGLIGTMAVWENMLLGQLRSPEFSPSGFLSEKNCQRHVTEQVRQYSIRLGSIGQPVRSLSGGNRQKVILARELNLQPKVLVASQPVRGLDVGAAEMVYERLRAARNAGAAVLLISADLEEVLELADRVGVLYRGRIVREFRPGELTPAEIGHYMLSGSKEVAPA